MKKYIFLLLSVFVIGFSTRSHLTIAAVSSNTCKVSPLYQTTLTSGENVLVCSTLMTYTIILRGQERQKTSSLYTLNVQTSQLGTIQRVWQEFFPEETTIRPGMFTVGSTSLEQTLCFGYLFQGLFYIHLLDMTTSLTPYEEEPPVKNIDLGPLHVPLEEAVCPSRSCIPLPNLIESEWGEVIGQTQRIDLSYIDDIWSVVFHTPTLRISLRGEPQGEKTRWTVLEKIAMPEETPPSP